MIYTCLPDGDRFGWGIAGRKINAALARLTKVVDVSGTSAATVFDGPVLMAIQSFHGDPINPNVTTTGKMVGYGFCEEPQAARAYVDKWNVYDTVACGSQWMAEQMQSIGVRNTTVAIQGVDFDVFKLNPMIPKFPHFTVFSGGKLEYRKGHDLVVAIMAGFMREHLDVHLVASWGNLWPETMHTLEKSSIIHYERASNDWRDQAAAMLAANGVPMGRVSLPAMRTNADMAEIYQRCHVGLFPNRVEAGTNLVMCEAIACGLPVIADTGTGQGEIVRGAGQIKASPRDTSSAYIRQLSSWHLSPDALSVVGNSGAQLMRNLVSWDRCAEALLAAMMED